MDRKFIFMLCLIFYICENVSFSKSESPLLIKKIDSLINASTSDVLKANQSENVFPASLENVSNYSWNSSSNYTKSPQAHLESNNTIVNKEKEKALTRNDSGFVEKLYEYLSTNAVNVSLYGIPVNTTTPEEDVQPKMVNHYAVGRIREKENITSSSTRYANRMGTEPTKKSPLVKRGARLMTDSVESVMDKLFGEDFSEPGKKRQRQGDGSMERSSRRRQKMKKPGRNGEGEVFYFREADTTTEETTTEETTTASGTETTTASGTESTAELTGEIATASGVSPNVNYHYHFHHFGAEPPHM